MPIFLASRLVPMMATSSKLEVAEVAVAVVVDAMTEAHVSLVKVNAEAAEEN